MSRHSGSAHEPALSDGAARRNGRGGPGPRGRSRTGRPARAAIHACGTEPASTRNDPTSVTASSKRRATLKALVLGLCIGAIVVAAVWSFYPGFWKQPVVSQEQLAAQQREAMLVEVRRQQEAARSAAVASAPPPPAACAFEPLIPAASARDGHARMEHPFPGGPREKAKVFLRAARTASAEGRTRDAELALIATCRMHAEAATKPSLPLADVLARLGAGYVAAAARERQPQLHDQFIARAREVLRLSADIHDQALGPNAQRSLQARERVDTLEPQLASADAPAPQVALSKDAVPVRATAAARTTAPPPRKEARTPSPAAAPVPSSPDLRQRDADLARLLAQAEAVSQDPAGVRQRSEQALARRAQCADPSCLRDWYARRREELLGEF